MAAILPRHGSLDQSISSPYKSHIRNPDRINYSFISRPSENFLPSSEFHRSMGLLQAPPPFLSRSYPPYSLQQPRQPPLLPLPAANLHRSASVRGNFSSGMADHHKEEEKKDESLMEKIADKIQAHDSSSSSSSDSDEDEKTSSLKAKAYRLFGREKPVHRVLGGGKPADVFLWRDVKVSAGVLGGATAMWVLFDVLEYHLLTFVCHGLILALVGLFLWSNATTFIKKSPPRIPEVIIPEKPVFNFASALRIHINQAFATLRDIASGKDLKKFLLVIAGLWVLSVLGSCTDFLTLLYITAVLLFTVPIFYEKYEDQVDSYAEKAISELKKQYAVFDARVLSKIPRGPLKNKKSD